MKAFIPLVTLALTALLAGPAAATAEHHDTAPQAATAAPAPATAAAPMAEGTVKKVDKAAGKMTIAHGPLENLGMPPMTMVFRVKDAAMLDQVQAGDKIRFVADRIGGAFTVTALESVK